MRKKAASTSSTSQELSHQELDASFLSSDEESLPETSNLVATDTSRKKRKKGFCLTEIGSCFGQMPSED